MNELHYGNQRWGGNIPLHPFCLSACLSVGTDFFPQCLSKMNERTSRYTCQLIVIFIFFLPSNHPTCRVELNRLFSGKTTCSAVNKTADRLITCWETYYFSAVKPLDLTDNFYPRKLKKLWIGHLSVKLNTEKCLNVLNMQIQFQWSECAPVISLDFGRI